MREIRLVKFRPGAVTYSPDGATLAVAGQQNTVKLFDVGTGKEQASVQWSEGRMSFGHFNQVVFNRDGTWLAAARDYDFGWWKLPALTPVPRALDLRLWNCQVAFFPSGDRLAVGWNNLWRLESPSLTTWNPATSSEEPLFSDHQEAVVALDASPVGDLLTVACHIPVGAAYRNCVKMWDCGKSCWRSTLELDKTQSLIVRDICFSPDGQSIVTATGRFASVWDVATGQRLCKLEGHTGLVNAVCFSPDGRLVATGSKDGTLRLWDLPGGQQRAVYDWQTGVIRCVVFAPDGMTAAVIGDRNKVVLWDMDL